MDNKAELDSAITAKSKTSGNLRAINPNMVFSSSVQPNALSKLVGKGNLDNGFLARFEIVTGNSDGKMDIHNDTMRDPDHCMELYTEVVSYYARKVDPEGKARRLVFIPFDRSVHAYTQEMYDKHISKWKRGSDIKSRFDLKFYKLCVLFAINRRADAVMQEDAENAMWIMEFLNRTTNMSAEKIVVTHGGEIEDKLIQIITSFTKGKKGYATAGDIKDRIKKGNHPWDPAEVSKRLDRLVEVGDVVIDPRTAVKGKRTERYIVPSALGAAGLKVVQQAEKQRRSK